MKIENKVIEKDIWSVEVNGNTIKLENKFKTAKLFVNDELQDIYLGVASFSNLRFTGKLPDGKEVKVIFGGDFNWHCYIFVDNELVLES